MQIEEIAKYFPSGIARGEAFINRFEEKSHLEKSIRAKQHMLLMAPRRYGKTSLLTQVASEIGYPFCAMDLLSIHDEESIKKIFLDKVGRLVMELSPSVEQAKLKLFSIFKSMNPEISLSAMGQKLSLKMPDEPNNIADLFLKLDEVAVAFDKRAIVFMDEMQQIGFLESGHSIEALVRHAVERSRNITYCFSGSSRHLLKKMFGDSGRPLYRLCNMMEIGRISEAHYRPHLKKLSKERWGKEITEQAFVKIMQVTDDHPYYINVLCQNLWLEDVLPSAEKIESVWDSYVRANKAIIVDDILDLTLNQKKMLLFLARSPIKALYSSETMMQVKLSPGSIQRVMESLLEKDLVCLKNEEHVVLDPAVRYYLLNS